MQLPEKAVLIYFIFYPRSCMSFPGFLFGFK
uniref:Uncharacterized protein n=1 Tax=Anguilla anguilla TaxID=7936 RepID=A0A0E9UEC3_ANGAN